MPIHTIQNASIKVDVAADTGAVVSLIDKATSNELITEPRLAENFRLLLPLEDLRSNYIFGLEQTVSNVTASATAIELQWDGPLTNEHGTFDLGVTLSIEIVDEQVQWRCRVNNRTEHQLTEVWYAMLRGMTGLAEGEAGRDTEALVPIVNKHWSQPIFRDFGNTRGQTLGVHTSEHNFCYPGLMAMPWISFFDRARNRGLYFAALEETPRVKGINFQLEPSMAEFRSGGNWPRPDEVGDAPLGLVMHWTHFPFTPPGETFESAPVVLQFHEGDWRRSAEIFREWFDSQYPVVAPGSTWIRREQAFLHTMLMLPEDNLNFRYTDIPALAKAATDCNVTHMNITGWNVGGHDRGYPQYDPDPRLGTWEELEASIAACHELGMKVSFFVNCQPIDLTTDWYKEELHKYCILDSYGSPFYITSYWGMGTLSARSMFMTGVPFSEMNPAHPEVRELLISRFRKLAEIGADGLHIDKLFQTPMDFNPRLQDTSPDRAHHEGILRFVEELLAACRVVNPDFCFSYEGGWDRLFSYSDQIWWGNGEETAMKAAFPQMCMVTGIEQAYDFNKLNLAMLHGDNLLIGPANYNASMDHPLWQPLSAYIGELLRLRAVIFDIVCCGEKLDASEGIYRRHEPMVSVNDAFIANPDCRWIAHRDTDTGRRGIVLANLSGDPIDVTAGFIANGGACQVLQPFESVVEGQFPVSLTIPAERVAFVVDA
jgi:hypothetical protein